MKEQEIIRAIEQADDQLINAVISAVISRYSRVFPEWDVMFLSMHKDPKERAKDIKSHIRYLKKMDSFD